MQLAKCGQWEVHNVVIWIFPTRKNTLTFRGDANHGEQLAINIDFFA